MIDGHYIFTSKSAADAAIVAAGFSPLADDPVNFAHSQGFGKFWGDDTAAPIGQPFIENPEDPAGDWIHVPDCFYFHCRFTSGSLPSSLSAYLVTDESQWYETYGEYLQSEETE